MFIAHARALETHRRQRERQKGMRIAVRKRQRTAAGRKNLRCYAVAVVCKSEYNAVNIMATDRLNGLPLRKYVTIIN